MAGRWNGDLKVSQTQKVAQMMVQFPQRMSGRHNAVGMSVKQDVFYFCDLQVKSSSMTQWFPQLQWMYIYDTFKGCVN